MEKQTNHPILEMNISLIKIKYMPKKDLVTHKRSKQVKTIQKDELFLSLHVCQQSLTVLTLPTSFGLSFGVKCIHIYLIHHILQCIDSPDHNLIPHLKTHT